MVFNTVYYSMVIHYYSVRMESISVTGRHTDWTLTVTPGQALLFFGSPYRCLPHRYQPFQFFGSLSPHFSPLSQFTLPFSCFGLFGPLGPSSTWGGRENTPVHSSKLQLSSYLQRGVRRLLTSTVLTKKNGDPTNE